MLKKKQANYNSCKIRSAFYKSLSICKVVVF